MKKSKVVKFAPLTKEEFKKGLIEIFSKPRRKPVRFSVRYRFCKKYNTAVREVNNELHLCDLPECTSCNILRKALDDLVSK